MTAPDQPQSTATETYNPWTVVNLVFHHLADQGLHPILGASGDPGPPAADLLRALGIEPAAEGNRQVVRDIRQQLAELRAAVLGGTELSHVETSAGHDRGCNPGHEGPSDG